MNKNYVKPATEIAEVMMESHLLEGSGGGPSGAPTRVTNAHRSDYGDATNAW